MMTTEATPAPTAEPAAAPAPAPSAATALLGDQPAAAPTAAPDAAPAPAAPEAKPDEAPAVKLPGKDATPEQWAEFYKAIGAPEKAEDYKLPVPEGDDGAFAKTAAEWFKDAGVLPQQAEKLATAWNQFAEAQMAALDKQEADRVAALHAKNTAEAAELKNEWGQRFDENQEFARRAVRQFLPKENAAAVITALENAIGYKATIQMLHSIGKGLGEHDATPGLGAATGGIPSKSLAERLYPNMPS